MSTFSARDREFMERALHLAQGGLGWVNPNPMVGAVIVRGKQIVAEGFHANVGGPHAEIVALQKLSRKKKSAKGATLFVTLEPCCHQGRTPPCTEAILKAGFKRVVVACKDPNPKVAGKGIRLLKKHGITVEVGLCKQQAEEQNIIFRHWVQHQTPFVTLKMSVSLDGKISPAQKTPGKVFYLIGKPALQRVHKIRQSHDAICVGISTILQDDPKLTTRIVGQKKVRHPKPVILDGQARTPLNSQIMSRTPLLFVANKVDYFGNGFLIVQGNQHVGRLEVAVDNPFLMSVLNGVANLDE